MPFNPNYTITSKIASVLMRIEALKETVNNLPITPRVLKTLRDTARLKSTHYSTQIEGNRLTEKEVALVLSGKESVSGRVRDEVEIKGYYAAMEWCEKNIQRPLTETAIKTIHALVSGDGRKRVKPSPYREGQNVIRNSVSGGIVYMPPEAKDVPSLMKELVEWLNTSNAPVPISAAVAHYQFATIHPYYDGNGRTARLLTTLVLHKGGYGLKGVYSLEEYYARDLPAYYEAISRGEHHNCYFGRVEADITPWLEYFIVGMLDSFEHVKKAAQEETGEDKSAALRSLSPKQRKLLVLFNDADTVTARDVEGLFGFSPRSARLLCQQMVEEGFLIAVNPSDKARRYGLAEKYIGI
ncbi:MAG: Fic family protein [Synergistaceae bacterium]|nr:Fic family protein [Synergistaceae bacterium]